MKLDWLQLTVEIEEQIHYELFQGYCLINDYSRVIEYGREFWSRPEGVATEI